jgi:hypothetical protein
LCFAREKGEPVRESAASLGKTRVCAILDGMATVELSRAARAFRFGHAAIAVAFLLAIGYVWWCALTGRRDRRLRLAVVALMAEGAFVAANRGDCPLGGLQQRLGDPVPLFELVLPATAARRAVPVLGAVTAAGLLLLMRRHPTSR